MSIQPGVFRLTLPLTKTNMGVSLTTRLSVSLSVRQSEGTLLATGSYDGFARIWTKDGEMIWISCIVDYNGGMLRHTFLVGEYFVWYLSTLWKLIKKSPGHDYAVALSYSLYVTWPRSLLEQRSHLVAHLHATTESVGCILGQAVTHFVFFESIAAPCCNSLIHI